MGTPFWIEKACGHQVENATMEDVRIAIKETLNMDEEHGAFWVGHFENENVLEVHKDLQIFYISADNPGDQLKARLDSWKEIEFLCHQFLDENFEQVRNFVGHELIDRNPHSVCLRLRLFSCSFLTTNRA